MMGHEIVGSSAAEEHRLDARNAILQNKINCLPTGVRLPHMLIHTIEYSYVLFTFLV